MSVNSWCFCGNPFHLPVCPLRKVIGTWDNSGTWKREEEGSVETVAKNTRSYHLHYVRITFQCTRLGSATRRLRRQKCVRVLPPPHSQPIPLPTHPVTDPTKRSLLKISGMSRFSGQKEFPVLFDIWHTQQVLDLTRRPHGLCFLLSLEISVWSILLG